MSRSANWLLPATALLLAGNAATQAQPIDYTTLEQVFHEPVTTSATGKPQTASTAPVNMEIVTQDDIRRSGATSIPDVLQFVTGVDVRRYGIADAEVGIRGYNQPFNPRLLVLVNGRQVYLDDYGRVLWSGIPVQLAEIRQIEVIKGPNSALYGFNAVSGVINIITYDPLRDKINTATFTGGTQNYLAGSAVGTGQIGDRAGLRVSIGGFRADDYPPGPLPVTDALNRRNPQVGAFNVDGRAMLSPDVEAYVEGSMSDSRVAAKDFAADFDTFFTRTNAIRAGLSADTALGLLNLSAYRNGQEISVASLSLLSIPNWVAESEYVVQASDLVKIGADHVLRVGLEYRNNALTGPGFVNGTIGYNVYSASLMWNWQIMPELSLTTAVRVDTLYLRYSGTPAVGSGFSLADYNSAHQTVPSFNAGLVYNPTEQDTFRLMLARGVQLPSLVDFGLQGSFGTFGPVVVAGNPNLSAATVDNAEFDYDRVLPAIDSTLRVALFAQRNRDIISEPFAVPPVIGPVGLPVLIAANVGSSDAAGVELGVKGSSPSGFRWQLSYAYVATTDHTRLNRGPVLTSAVEYAHSAPRNVVIAGIGYSRDRWEVDLIGRWQSSYLDFRSTLPALSALQPVEVRNYLSLNARIGYRLTEHLVAAVTAQQFNQSSLLQTAGPPVERRVLASITAGF
ncbi:MAG TPA: TonB-dependent receptor [Acetobacteraceae bacterium]